MAWIYFQELAELELPSNRGLEPLPIVSVTDTLKASYCPGCDQVTLTRPRSGTMSQHSEPICCHESTSYSGDFLARISVLQGLEKAWQESEVAFSSRSSGLPESATPDLFSSKTSLPSEPVEGKEWSKNWPRSGMTVDGRLYQPPQLEPHTKETGGSYWRTPNANDAARGPMGLETALNGGHQLALVTQVRHPELWPTPTATSYGSNKGGAAGRTGKERLSLETMARKNLWPTPCAMDHLPPKSDKALERVMTEIRPGRTGAPSLKDDRRLWGSNNPLKWPTPRASEYKDCGPVGSKSQVHMDKRDYLCAKAKDASNPTGQLNPQWVEWLMGYPIGHTELDALVIQWFRSK